MGSPGKEHQFDCLGHRPAEISILQKEPGYQSHSNVDDQILPKLLEITGGDMAQIVFDATGIKGPMEKSIDYLSSGGQYILVGLNRGDLSFNHPSMHARELSILCSRNATRLILTR